jgi:hypothetical protein
MEALYRALNHAMRSPDIRKRPTDQGAEPFFDTLSAVVARAQAERKLWAEGVLRKTGMKLY